MKFILDKNQKSTFFEQAREQLISALHTGKIHSADRLPSMRQVAKSNQINTKTVFTIYQRLQAEGYITLRTGSGAYVADVNQSDLNQAYCLSLLRLIKSNLAQAQLLKFNPEDYSRLLRKFIDKSRPKVGSMAVIECNEEQIEVFAHEILSGLNLSVVPLLLSELKSPDRSTAKLLNHVDYFATTDFHFNEVKSLTARYQKKVLQLRLNPIFIPTIVEEARRGCLLMVVSNTDYFPAFRRSLLGIGTPRSVVERIAAVDDHSPNRLRSLIQQAKAVYVSPVCDPRVSLMIPRHLKRLEFDCILSQESMETIEAITLFHDKQDSH